jgi:hypothetical protein
VTSYDGLLDWKVDARRGMGCLEFGLVLSFAAGTVQMQNGVALV